jgi:uncharacterized protein
VIEVVTRFDSVAPHLSRSKGRVIELPGGGLELDGVLTRSGVFEYQRLDGSIARELRHPDDLTHPDALRSLQNVPITLRHPKALLNDRTAQGLSQGQVGSDIRQEVGSDGEVHLISRLKLRRAAASALRSGELPDLSVGLQSKVIPERGIYRGQRYDCRQTQLKFNHVSLVEKGRCDCCQPRMDSGDEEGRLEGRKEAFHAILQQRSEGAWKHSLSASRNR